jgi:hypothetical protein
MASELRYGKPSGTVVWSDGSLFDGILAVGIKGMVDGGGAAWPSATLGNRSLHRTLPIFAPIDIVEGVFDANAGVFYNEDLTPPGTQYVAWYYDSTGKQVAGPSAAFTVTASSFTVPALTLTVPSIGPNPVPN